MHRPRADARVVDIVAVDPDQRSACADQPLGRRRGQERMIVIIAVAAPMPVPAGMDQHRAAAHVEPFERAASTASPSPTAAGRRSPAGRASASIRHRSGPCRRRSDGTARRHRCRCWRPCRSGRSGRSRPVVVIGGGLLARQEVADVRAGQALVGHHPVGDDVAQVDDPLRCAIFHNATAPIPIQTTLSAVEGMARCHQPLITKPAAPTMFIH